MDRLWTPWRYNYVSRADRDLRKGVPAGLDAWPGDLGCVFCNMIAAVDFAIDSGAAPEEAERAAHIVHRGATCFVCLNAFPYSTGHVMIIPYRHTDSLAKLEPEAATEMIALAQQTEACLRRVYRPDGLNLGINLGEAAGAGVADHLHLHALPRWSGDTNFMTVIAETRILPEALDVTWERLSIAFRAEAAGERGKTAAGQEQATSGDKAPSNGHG
jgi:ATP adenylyltransferase